MLETAALIMTTIALMLGVVSTANTGATTYEKHTNVTYAQATAELLRNQQADITAQIAQARYEGDALREAEYQAMLGTLRTLERRLNPDAVVRQSLQEREAFLDDQWQVFKTTVVSYGVTKGLSATGFGKVAGSHMRGTNWPPDPNKSLVLYDPTTRQMTRVLLAPDRPILEIIDYTEEIGSFFDGIQNSLEVVRNTAPVGDQDLLSGRDAYTVASEGLERMTGMRPLPANVGDYLARAAVRRAERDNAQVAGLPDEERIPFLRDQACARLLPLYGAESDRYRSETLLAALSELGCTLPAAAARPETGPKEQGPDPGQVREEPEGQAASAQLSPSEPSYQPSTGHRLGEWVVDGPPVLENKSNPAEARDHWVTDCTASSKSLALEEREVSRTTGELLYTLSVAAEIEAPPDVLKPNDRITLAITVTQSGSPPPWSPHHYEEGLEIYLGGKGPDSYIQDPSLRAGRHAVHVWDKGSSEPQTMTWTLTIPPGESGDSLQLYAEFWHAYTCRVTWNYVMP